MGLICTSRCVGTLLEVRRQTANGVVPVDPYGWQGPSLDSYIRAVNINLWIRGVFWVKDNIVAYAAGMCLAVIRRITLHIVQSVSPVMVNDVQASGCNPDLSKTTV